jgi:Winged helix DNA-binding domain
VGPHSRVLLIGHRGCKWLAGRYDRAVMTLRISDDERRRRIGVRHRLAEGSKAESVAEAARSLVVLHATDPATVFLEVWARTTESSPESIEHELYEEPTVLRMLAMRRTLWLVPLPDVAMIFAAGSRDVAERERPRTLKILADGGSVPYPADRFAELEDITLAAIRQHGEVATPRLRDLDPRLAERVTIARGKNYQGSMPVISRVVHHLALDGRIGRGRPRGTWISGQFCWSPIERWFSSGIPPMPIDEARAELVRRWLRTFGPGTRDDIRWWTGWTVGLTRAALGAAGAVEVSLDGGAVGYELPDDLDETPPVEPWVAFLPALDATTMAWAVRDWYLGPHRPRLFDTNGNAGPTIWVDGRIVGGWAHRRSGEVVPMLLEDIGTDTRRRIEAEAGRLETWLGPARVSGSFPTPLETDLRTEHGT